MKKLYLHIGVHKTGTTFIQRFMATNRARLRERGVLYPESPGEFSHNAIPLAFSSKRNADLSRRMLGVVDRDATVEFRGEFVKSFRKELDEFEGDKVVLSSELLSSRFERPMDLVRLREWLGRHFSEVTVIVYLRRQDDLFLSHYSTMIKKGRTGDPEPGSLFWFHYDRLLDGWAQAFGQDRVRPRLFESASFTNGKLEDDFLGCLGIDSSEGFEGIERINESLDSVRLEFLRMFNAHVPIYDGDQMNPLRGDIGGALVRQSGGEGAPMTLAPEVLASFLEGFDAGNAEVARRYFGREDGQLFRPGSGSAKRALYRAITAEEAVHIAAELWTGQRKRILALERKVETLKAR